MKKIITTAFTTMIAFYAYSQEYLPLTGGTLSGAIYRTATVHPSEEPIVEYGHSSYLYKAGIFGKSNYNSNLGTGLLFKTMSSDGALVNAFEISPDASATFKVARTSGTNRNVIYLLDNVTGGQPSGYGTRIVGLSNSGNAESAIGFESYGGTNNDTGISFYTQPVAGGLSRQMIISSTGSIGIGTSTPSYTLDLNKVVNGNYAARIINASGATSSDGGLIVETSTASSAKVLSLRTNGVENFSLDGTATAVFKGNVGIGANNPTAALHLKGTGKEFFVQDDNLNTAVLGGWDGASQYLKSINLGVSLTPLTVQASSVTFDGGAVNIGTTQTNANLYVNGTVKSKEVKVEATVTVPDYVFEKSYDLKPLAEVEKYVSQNKHLPEIPSAREIEADGIKVGEMQMKLLQKIEELTLHLIEQDKTNKKQQELIEFLLKNSEAKEK